MSSRTKAMLLVLIDLVLPIGLYYVLRAAGVSYHSALLISSLLPGLSVVANLVRLRKPDGLSLFMTGMMVGSAAISLLVHDPRLLLAKDGWITAISGLWFLASVRGRQPLVFAFTRFLLEGRVGPLEDGGSRRVSWDVLWERLPAFRRIWRVATVLWGIGLLADAVVRVTMAYTLPPDVVPGLGGLQYAVFMVLMQVVMACYLVPTGLYNRWSPLYFPLKEIPA
ncbi:VC0807 family protein [Nonomuraea guangzhouensis]|uniref:VC0807 family protein n=1 Tax=Nonomuraea guangzhouensis TaxID=1291555 RepID=A0ABW4G8H6_9ACTN|nr:VC0807 family protein [Nonomuraea guangzhouensis]